MTTLIRKRTQCHNVPALSEVNLQLNQISFQYSTLGCGGMGELHLSVAADFQQLHDVIVLIWTINMHQDHRGKFPAPC